MLVQIPLLCRIQPLEFGLNPKNETLGKRHTVQGKELQVAKKRVGRYPKEFRRMAVERLKKCDNIVALSRELGVHRRLLYKWRDQLDPAEVPEESPPQNSRESTLRKEVSQLKRLLADKAVEVDFFRGALQKVEARRQRRGSSGEKASTTRSNK
ncbi:MAG: transposase [Acidobacteria bacterium]|nr:MAG: transposase [Acidobacteriota bacterium]